MRANGGFQQYKGGRDKANADGRWMLYPIAFHQIVSPLDVCQSVCIPIFQLETRSSEIVDEPSGSVHDGNGASISH